MSNALAERRIGGSLALEEEELIPVLQSSLYPNAAPQSIKLVLGYCRASGLDPMQKPVHIVPMWDKESRSLRDVIMPGIGLYRTQAARSGQLAGISEPEFGPDVTENIGGGDVTYPAWCKVTVSRRLNSGEIGQFTACERWKENYAIKGGKDQSIAPNAMWSRRPYAQLAKCAQAQALRMAFPEMVGAAPTADEMDGRTIDAESVVIDNGQQGATDGQRQKKEPLPAYNPDEFEARFEEWERYIKSGKTTAERLIPKIETKGVLTEDQKKRLHAITIEEHAE